MAHGPRLWRPSPPLCTRGLQVPGEATATGCPGQCHNSSCRHSEYLAEGSAGTAGSSVPRGPHRGPQFLTKEQRGGSHLPAPGAGGLLPWEQVGIPVKAKEAAFRGTLTEHADQNQTVHGVRGRHASVSDPRHKKVRSGHGCRASASAWDICSGPQGGAGRPSAGHRSPGLALALTMRRALCWPCLGAPRRGPRRAGEAESSPGVGTRTCTLPLHPGPMQGAPGATPRPLEPPGLTVGQSGHAREGRVQQVS